MEESSLLKLEQEFPEALQNLGAFATRYGGAESWKLHEDLENRFLDILQRVRREGTPNTTLAKLETLAATYKGQSRWKEAEELELIIAEVSKVVLGPEHPHTITAISNLAASYRDRSRWEESEALSKDVVEICQRTLGEENPRTLLALDGLAATYLKQGHWGEAARLLEQNFELAQRVLGEGHPHTLANMTSLALTYRSQGRWKEAEQLGYSVRDISIRTLGSDHPRTLLSIADLATTYRYQGRWDEAEELASDVVDKSVRFLGEDHPYTVKIKADLASTLREQGRSKEAEKMEEKLLKKVRRQYGEDHPETIMQKSALAATYRKQRRWQDSLVLEEQVYIRKKADFGEFHPDTLECMANLAQLYLGLQNIDEAEKTIEIVIDKRKAHDGENNQKTLAAMSIKGSVLTAQGQIEPAKSLLEKTIKLQEEFTGGEHPETVESICKLAAILSKEKGRLSLGDAKELYLRVFRVWEKSSNGKQSSYARLEAMQNLISIYNRLGEDKPAKETSKSFITKLYEAERSSESAVPCKFSRAENGEMRLELLDKDSVEESIKTTSYQSQICVFDSNHWPSWIFNPMLRHFGLSQAGKDFRVVNAQSTGRNKYSGKDDHSNEAYAEPVMAWKWNYEHKFRSNVVDYRMPRIEDIERSNWGSFSSSITFIFPTLQGTKGLKKTDLSTVDEAIRSRTISWIMQTENIPLSHKPLSPVSPTSASASTKYLRTTQFFVTEAQEIGFPETAADFIITNLEYMGSTWRDNIQEAEKRMDIRHENILEKNGTDETLVQKLLRDLRMFNEWKKILAGHIVCCSKLSRILQDESFPFVQEEKVYCQKWNVDQGPSIKPRMQKVQKKFAKYNELVANLINVTGNYVTLEFNLSSIHEVHVSTQMSMSMKRMSWITFIFLPLVFVASIFGMNVDILAKDPLPQMFWYPVGAIILLVVVLIFWLVYKIYPIETFANEHFIGPIRRAAERRRNRLVAETDSDITSDNSSSVRGSGDTDLEKGLKAGGGFSLHFPKTRVWDIMHNFRGNEDDGPDRRKVD